MIKKKQRSNSNYIPPELMNIVHGAALVSVVNRENEKAKSIFDEIIVCCQLPGVQLLQEETLNLMPSKQSDLYNEIIEKSGIDLQQPPEKGTYGIPYVREIIEGTNKMIADYTDKVMPVVERKKLIMRDFNISNFVLAQYILAGFNHEADVQSGNYKVTAKDEYPLGGIVFQLAQMKANEHILKAWEKLKIIHYAGKQYSYSDTMSNGVALRLHRQLMAQYKQSGFLLKHNDTLLRMASNWYQSRVIYSGPEEYCRETLLKTGVTLYPSNISNEIKAIDDLVGYPRKKYKET